jgi:hypothetical protein
VDDKQKPKYGATWTKYDRELSLNFRNPHLSFIFFGNGFWRSQVIRSIGLFRNEPDQTDSLLEFHRWCKQICEL